MRNLILSGSLLLLSVRLITRILSLVSMLVLARLLVPEDFAVLAIAMIVVQFLDVICNTGAQQYLVQARTIDDNTVDTAWTLDLLCRTLAMLLVFASLPFVQAMWDDTQVTLVAAVLAPTLLLNALQSPALNMDVRELNFRRVFAVEVTRKLVAVIVGITVAIAAPSVWAMVIAMYFSSVTSVLLSHSLCRRRLRLSLTGVGEQWRFSKWVVGRGMVGFLRGQADLLLASRFFGIATFGQYTLARELSIMPATDLFGPMLQPMFSSFAKVRDDKAQLVRQLRITVLALSLVVTPLTLFLWNHGPIVAELLLGSKWIDAGPMLSALAPLVFIYSIGQASSFLLLARGQAKTLFMTDSLSLLIVATSLWAVRNLEVMAFIDVRCGVGFVLTLSMFLYFCRAAGLSIPSALGVLTSPLLAALPAIWISGVLTPTERLNWLVLDVGLRAVAYFGAYALLLMIVCALLQSHNDDWRYLLTLAKDIGQATINRTIKALSSARTFKQRRGTD